jgi:PTS system nitrogen regulatory IIA component
MAEEDFDVSSLAAFLHLTPDQVRKMADRGKLPGRRVGGKWRFSRAEIHGWFENRIGVSDAQELSQVEKVLEWQNRNGQNQRGQNQNGQNQDGHNDDIHIPTLLSSTTTFVPFLARTKSSVIEKICELSSQSGALWEPAKMADAIRSREELHPTALENGVALLHPRRPLPSIMGEPFLSLGITSSGIPFGGPRGCLTDVFFLIGSVNESQHLRVLARLSRLIHHGDLLDNLRTSDSPGSAWQAIEDADNELEG